MPINCHKLICALAVCGWMVHAADMPPLKEIPLLDCSGIPCVDLATASGKTLRLLIDTGSTNSYLNQAAAANLGLEVKPLIGGNGQPINEVQQTIVPGAKLGELPMGDFPFMVIAPDDPTQTVKKIEPLPGDGAFAYTAFRNRILQLDFKNRVLRVSEPLPDDSPACPQNCGNIRLEHFGNMGPATITTDGFAVNGQPVKAQVNTTFTGTILIYPLAVKKLDLGKQSKSHKKDAFPYTQGGVKLVHGEAETVTFSSLPLQANGPAYFATADLQDTPDEKFDATVGTGLFTRSVVTFDFKSFKMWIEN